MNGLLDRVFEGYNGSVFAHGSTGSGKTYTMTGGATKNNGVVQQTIKAMRERFLEMRNDVENLKVTGFMCQLYKSSLVDLLRPGWELPRALEIV